jgi:hypothetical protein
MIVDAIVYVIVYVIVSFLADMSLCIRCVCNSVHAVHDYII